LLPDLSAPAPDYVFVAGNVWTDLCTGEFIWKAADQFVEVFSAQGLGLASAHNSTAITFGGYSHPFFLDLLHPGLVNVTGAGHPGYQLMLAFATGQLTGQLQLSTTAAPDPVRPGEMLTYTLTVSNRGTTDLTGVVLTDVVPAQVNSFSESETDGGDCPSITCDPGEMITWNLGTLFAGQSVSKQVRMTVDTSPTPADGTLIRNSARVFHPGEGFIALDETIARVCAAGGTACDHIPPDGFCGDSILNPGEQCDDGNTLDGDCCSSMCQFEAAGSSCNDGNACTQTDTCQAGVCTGANPVVCTALDQCHDVGVCDPTTGTCSNPAKLNGTICEDGLFCTVGDTCQAGVCTGSARDCSDAIVCTADSCDEAANQCVHDPTSCPFLRVTAPNGSEVWPIGCAQQTIRWTSSGVSGNVKIKLSRDEGAAYPETLFSGTANDGTQKWTVKGPATTQARMQICSVNNPSICDTSDANFTIGGGRITVSTPNGGETWSIGSYKKIRWTSSGICGQVKIQLSRDGGATWTTLFSGTANDGVQRWKVTGSATAQARIQICSVSDPSVCDKSNANFVIQ
jgi:uncharacterized repeat protein (TIGR01451 family)